MVFTISLFTVIKEAYHKHIENKDFKVTDQTVFLDFISLTWGQFPIPVASNKQNSRAAVVAVYMSKKNIVPTFSNIIYKAQTKYYYNRT